MKKGLGYWACTYCKNVENKEREILCWKCGRGEMIYHPYANGGILDNPNYTKDKETEMNETKVKCVEYKSQLEVIGVLHAIELIDFHNKFYLTDNRKFLNEEKRRLLDLLKNNMWEKPAVYLDSINQKEE